MSREALIKAKQAGYSDRQIAKLLGCTDDDVRARRKKVGIPT